MVKRSVSTARSVTAFSCMTRRCGCHSSSPDQAPASRTIDDRVALIDVAPTVVRLGLTPFDADGIDLGPLVQRSQAPGAGSLRGVVRSLLDFGWSPLHAIRSREWKYIEAPRPELYNVDRDPDEERDSAATCRRSQSFTTGWPVNRRPTRQRQHRSGSSRACSRRSATQRIGWRDQRPPRGSEGQEGRSLTACAGDVR